jgi:hypothetical protein
MIILGIYILNLDGHNFSLDYPLVMTPLSNTQGNFSVYLVCMSSL